VQGTILDFLRLASEKPELTQDLLALAAKYDFQFSDEVSDDDLDAVSGGAVSKIIICYSVIFSGHRAYPLPQSIE
jgi:hypothetical protein